MPEVKKKMSLEKRRSHSRHYDNRMPWPKSYTWGQKKEKGQPEGRSLQRCKTVRVASDSRWEAINTSKETFQEKIKGYSFEVVP